MKKINYTKKNLLNNSNNKSQKDGSSLPELKLKSEPVNPKKVVKEEVGAEFKQIISMKRKIISEIEIEVKFFFDEFEYLRGKKIFDQLIILNILIIINLNII